MALRPRHPGSLSGILDELSSGLPDDLHQKLPEELPGELDRPELSGRPMVGIGIDLVDVQRFGNVLTRTPRFLVRVFTDGELAASTGRADEVGALAARFAAKEAVVKCLAGGIFAQRLVDIEVISTPGGPPSLRLFGAAKRQADALGASSWAVSLSHDRSVAGAVVVALAD